MATPLISCHKISIERVIFFLHYSFCSHILFYEIPFSKRWSPTNTLCQQCHFCIRKSSYVTYNLPIFRNDDSVAYDKDANNKTSGMDPDGFIENNWHEIIDNFDDMNLKEELLRGVYGYGFERPSAIQQRAIIPCVRGLDVIAQAQSGTGKTATFSIAILQQIDTKILDCQALILAPTRELATQIQKVVIALGDYMNAECLACIGGTNVQEDMRKLEMGTHIVVGTPGKFQTCYLLVLQCK